MGRGNVDKSSNRQNLVFVLAAKEIDNSDRRRILCADDDEAVVGWVIPESRNHVAVS